MSAPLTDRERERIQYAEVSDGRGFTPWTCEQADAAGRLRRVKAHVGIEDGEGGVTVYRLRTVDGNTLGILAPEDDEEPEP